MNSSDNIARILKQQKKIEKKDPFFVICLETSLLSPKVCLGKLNLDSFHKTWISSTPVLQPSYTYLKFLIWIFRLEQ